MNTVASFSPRSCSHAAACVAIARSVTMGDRSLAKQLATALLPFADVPSFIRCSKKGKDYYKAKHILSQVAMWKAVTAVKPSLQWQAAEVREALHDVYEVCDVPVPITTLMSAPPPPPLPTQTLPIPESGWPSNPSQLLIKPFTTGTNLRSIHR